MPTLQYSLFYWFCLSLYALISICKCCGYKYICTFRSCSMNDCNTKCCLGSPCMQWRSCLSSAAVQTMAPHGATLHLIQRLQRGEVDRSQLTPAQLHTYSLPYTHLQQMHKQTPKHAVQEAA